MFAAPLVLSAVGFGAAGPVGGSLAALWQSGIGSVEAGSLFASKNYNVWVAFYFAFWFFAKNSKPIFTINDKKTE